MNPIHLFRAGTHTDRYGREYTFSAEDVRRIGEVYNPDLYKAPLQIDHEGRLIDGFLVEAGTVGEHLLGIPSEVSPSFAKAAKGRQVSLQLFTPEAENNPVPGTWGIAHVALVKEGAIKLLPPEFSKDDPQRPVFTLPPQFGALSELIRFLELLKELISQGVTPEKAEEIISESLLQAIRDGDDGAETVLALEMAKTLPSYSKPLTPTEQELQDLKAKVRNWEIQSELQAKVFGPGKLPPRLLQPVTRFLQAIEGQPAVQFSADSQQTPYQFAVELLASLPTVLPTSEITAPPKKPEFSKGDLSNPQYTSPEAEEIREYQAACAKKNRKLSFTEARAELLEKRKKGE